jgi:hypothetical protein
MMPNGQAAGDLIRAPAREELPAEEAAGRYWLFIEMFYACGKRNDSLSPIAFSSKQQPNTRACP